MLSLFDYLGKPAGKDLGKLVNEYARLINQNEMGMRFVETKNYKGNVMIYPKEFLDGFFAVKKLFDGPDFTELNTELTKEFEKQLEDFYTNTLNRQKPVNDLPF